MDYAKESLHLHGEWKGKIEMVTRVPVKTKDGLSLAYTPGVAQPVRLPPTVLRESAGRRNWMKSCLHRSFPLQKIDRIQISVAELCRGYEERGTDGIEGIVAYGGPVNRDRTK